MRRSRPRAGGSDVTLIDKRNYHLFQPLLYQVATAGLSPADIAAPIRSILARQRNRWHRGLMQTFWLHRDMIFNPRYGSVGLLGLPYFLIFELFGPLVEVLGYVSLLAALALGILDVEFFVLFLAVAILYGMTLSVAAVLLEEISFRRYPAWTDLVKLFTFALLENLGYASSCRSSRCGRSATRCAATAMAGVWLTGCCA